jgi:SAM-dependent methyltransferase
VQALPAPDRLTFVTSEPDAIPAPNDTFDVVFSWSTFEHVSKPVAMLREIKRILKPSGVFFLQIWPLYYSEHGGHLWQLIPEPFPQLQMPPYAIERRIQGRLGTDRSRDALDEFRSLNRMTLDDLQRALLAAGLRPAKVELMSQVFHVPQPLAHFSLSALAVAGVKMLVVAG